MKNRFYIFVFFITIIFINKSANAQLNRPLSDADKAALEGIIVEKYYTYDPNDNLDTAGGALPIGAVTYRIYVDLKTDYTLQAVYGVTDHQLFIKTTTSFYNNMEFGQGTGDYTDPKRIAGSTAAFDSWLTLGKATKDHVGILKNEDSDGSILKVNSMEKADGLLPGKTKAITIFGLMPPIFNLEKSANTFATDNGSWAMFGGVKGATDDNKILIAQLTTDGVLSFELNIQVGTPKGGNINYVAKDPEDQEIKYDALKYSGK